MRVKRGLFIGALLALFLCCFHIMNQHYDELSRYQYANDENRKLILEYMTTEDINYLIDRQYKPEEFLEYLGMPHFDIRYVDWYNYAKGVGGMDDASILELVDTMKDQMSYSTFKVYCSNYSLTQLKSFYLEENAFVHDQTLISNPSSVTNKIEKNMTLFTYEPKDLVEVSGIPIVNQIQGKETIQLSQNTAKELVSMCNAAFEINEKTCGNMVVTTGYISFDTQEQLYEEALLTYGIDDVFAHVDYPGQSVYQLGNVVRLVVASVETTELQETEISPQQLWLIEHAHEYGFEFVNDPARPLEEFILQYHEELKKSNEEGDEAQ